MARDYCPDGDLSPSYYDRECLEEKKKEQKYHWSPKKVTKPISKEMFDKVLNILAKKNNLSQDMVDKLRDIKYKKNWRKIEQKHHWSADKPFDLFENTDSDIIMTRKDLAKVVSVLWIKYLWKQRNYSRSECWTFNDMYKVNWNKNKYYIKLACQIWVMWINNKKQPKPKKIFEPNQQVNWWEFATAISRILYENENNGWDPYYPKHIKALQQNDIISNDVNPLNYISRKEVFETISNILKI